ncbi:unnamed protein product [Polarella glacialis]|uniref:Uncharacterized protein n=1 Tax=Polarella glacialis TaxID=89957 RepID=A0A813E341_POLGL|nr:unnamed protein product [Polarella glacialis]
MGKRGGAGTEYKENAAEEKKDGTVVKAWQRMPTVILSEWAQTQKRPKPQFSGIRPYDRAMVRFKVTLPDPKDAAKNLVFEPNRDSDSPFTAREEAALVALLKLCPTFPLERKLPDPYRETWLAAITPGASQAAPKSKASAKPKAKAAALQWGDDEVLKPTP